jgi:hypothetical protein
MYIAKRNGVVYESMGDTTTPVTATATSPAAVATPDAPFSLRDTINGQTVSTGAAIALTYHGYKRTGSLAWALIYGVMGKWFPVEAVPIALAQGFGQRKPCP